MPDWYRTHDLSPEAYPDSEYRNWAQDSGLHVDAAGNVDYGPPQAATPDICRPPADPDVYGGDDDGACDHICEDFCEDEDGGWSCSHQHCGHCGECGCAGYCDDVQTYNLRPAETGGSASYPEGGPGA